MGPTSRRSRILSSELGDADFVFDVGELWRPQRGPSWWPVPCSRSPSNSPQTSRVATSSMDPVELVAYTFRAGVRDSIRDRHSRALRPSVPCCRESGNRNPLRSRRSPGKTWRVCSPTRKTSSAVADLRAGRALLRVCAADWPKDLSGYQRRATADLHRVHRRHVRRFLRER